MSTIPVVLLHGVGLDSSMWTPVREALGRESVALDLPGHGGQPPLTQPVTLAEMADGVLARLPERSHLVGFSLGALVAQHIAAFHPERVETLTCVSSVCRRTEAESRAVEDRLAVAEADFAASTEASIERWYAGTTVPEALVEDTRRVLQANDPESFLHAYRVFARGDAAIAPELGHMGAPTLALTGELDPGSTPDMTRRLAEAIPGARALIVPGARHMLPVQDPQALVLALNEFIHDTEGAVA
ncbi:alpha/beta fold hydrolase [Sinomonas cellulolyticus]|nr:MULTISPECIES: alpha/beta fold hydrolase [Sinomonas]